MLGSVLPAWDKTKPFLISSIQHDQVQMKLGVKSLKVKQRHLHTVYGWLETFHLIAVWCQHSGQFSGKMAPEGMSEGL